MPKSSKKALQEAVELAQALRDEAAARLESETARLKGELRQREVELAEAKAAAGS